MEPWMKAIISLAVVAVSLYIILTRPEDEAARQWAVGVLSFILGWLKGGEPLGNPPKYNPTASSQKEQLQ